VKKVNARTYKCCPPRSERTPFKFTLQARQPPLTKYPNYKEGGNSNKLGVMERRLCHYRTLTYKYECVLSFQTIQEVGGFPLPLPRSSKPNITPITKFPRVGGGYKTIQSETSVTKRGVRNKVTFKANHSMENRVGQGRTGCAANS
jgi:hypothetical protein